MRTFLLKEADFGHMVRSGASRGRRIICTAVDGDRDSSGLFQQAGQLEEQHLDDFANLMVDLCRKARSGEPLATLFGRAWRVLSVLTSHADSPVAAVSIFSITRRKVEVVGFMPTESDIVVVGCRSGPRRVSATELTHYRQAVLAYFDCRNRGNLLQM